MRTPILPLVAAALLSLTPLTAAAQLDNDHGEFRMYPDTPHIGQPFSFSFNCLGASDAILSYNIQLATGTVPLTSGQAVCPSTTKQGNEDLAFGSTPGLPGGLYTITWGLADSATFTVAGAQPIVPLLYYTLINQGTTAYTGSLKFCLDVPYNTNNGAYLNTDLCQQGVSSQQWMFIPTDSGYYTVTNRNIQIDPNNLLNEYPIDLDVADEATDNGSVVHAWQNLFLPNQQWKPVLLSDGNFTLIGRASQRCLSGGLIDDSGTLPQQEPTTIMDCNGSAQQEWNLVPVLSQR